MIGWIGFSEGSSRLQGNVSKRTVCQTTQARRAFVSLSAIRNGWVWFSNLKITRLFIRLGKCILQMFPLTSTIAGGIRPAIVAPEHFPASESTALLSTRTDRSILLSDEKDDHTV